ncbi:tRNA A37 threonylcarbamoyladenosine synthetase subunit TsaC/SUA5/YrdC (TsaC) (PDB:1HRU) [Commensalibacter communis]|uniref:Threonylcarbamoyl-AMP synthase n=1 Tax=Commensalibacter communis TaxID=2972786 RepID=A0A9W4TLT8_9PROT|nr:L-threonylcarbamoyladenylate synthase [Commensalibacter communis]CAI3924387.1 tRNA A37 threonylcarbamoyladenosine synthetase subunit TsaC/SUA5/YrdC (TsaC) (PDB:1HRU) [Commensalibacter communis]CAI3925865.1 tRNA A37 threonylcarbamoyladenosine synthetase subunit TsaC/SUA5/YrdC (TsaC) (PDB:1HRU) [Commensalibacter communis]CAI3936573.1 tRNA A37 threonylcarbamoyladenosine synthetase subunit TsaC/SUA5/YrdC (TsaC) (PDB:1HRU) [Commensalibacter communis]CAI3937116.1 tRNA A37 threonylcarbamoyladenosin
MTSLFSDSLSEIQQAATIIKHGGVVAFGTETVYGLGADATNTKAVEKIYRAKGRPSFNPLIIHFAELDHLFQFVQKTELAYELALKFWPGALTLVLNQRTDNPIKISPIATAYLPTMAVRIPNTKVARQLIQFSKKPIAAPSANNSGKISPSTAQHVFQELNHKIDAIIDSGPCQVGVESTILDLSRDTPTLLRPGGISLEALTSICGTIEISHPIETKIISPGQLSSHYAPSLPVRLNCTHVAPDEALLAFGHPIEHTGLSKNLSINANLEEAAQNLFAYLRDLDAQGQALGLKGIAVMSIPQVGLGLAICDRLTRAAAPRTT